MKTIVKYVWILPALFVAYEFGGKLFEVLVDSSEFADIISVIVPNHNVATILAYAAGGWDFLIALALLIIPNLKVTKKYANYIFTWVIFWPLVPSSIRYFGGVADFEIAEVSAMIAAAILSFLLYKKLNK